MRVHSDREGLDQRARPVVHRLREREQHSRIHHDAVGVAARAPGAEADAVGDGGGAHLLGAREAGSALPALRERQHADAIARVPALDALPQLADGAGELVARHGAGGKQRGNVTEVQVGAADPAEGDIDGDLPRPGLRRGPLDHPQQPILTDLDRAHGAV